MDPINERHKTYKCCPLKAAFMITARHSYNILRSHCAGINIRFRAQANESVAESTRHRFDYPIWQISLGKSQLGPFLWPSTHLVIFKERLFLVSIFGGALVMYVYTSRRILLLKKQYKPITSFFSLLNTLWKSKC